MEVIKLTKQKMSSVKTRIISLILAVLTVFSVLIPGISAFASTSSAIEITSDYLFEQSTLDDLQLNFNTLPSISVSGLSSDKYQIITSDKTWWFQNPVKNIRIEFLDKNSNQTLNFGTNYSNFKITATYSNCGTLNGKSIDLVLTYSDFWTAYKSGSERYDTKSFWWTAYGTPEQQTAQNEWFMVGFSKFNFDIKFKYHDSTSYIKLDNAYFTLYSMDGSRDESGRLTHGEALASDTASNAYWYKERNMMYNATWSNGLYSENNLYYGGYPKPNNYTRATENVMALQYENKDSINLDMLVISGQFSEGYHVNFTPPTAVIPDAPIKSVSPTSTTANSDVIYTIEQKLPIAYDKDFNLDSLTIQDTLDSSLEYSSASVKDNSAKDITSSAGKLDYNDITHTLTYTFDKEYLETVDYNGSVITLTISVKTAGDISDKVLTNEAITYINDSSIELTSNSVQLGIYYPVTVQYVDENDTPLADEITQNYNVGEKYQTLSKDIENYQLLRVEGDESGIINNAPVTVKYVYALKDTNVTANYKDESGKTIADSETINGKVFDDYKTTAKDIYGYELTATPSNATGTMTVDPITVDYIYRLKDAKVTVKWVDDSGTDLAASQTITGKVFDPYSTEAKTFYGYRLTATPQNATGTMTEDEITVTYIYTKRQAAVTANYIDENNNVLSDPVSSTGNVGDAYTTSAKDINGYELISTPSNANGTYTEDDIVVNYIYRLKNASVTANYVDEEGTPLTSSVTINGKFFDTYNTENKSFNGYELIAIPDNASGTMDKESTIVNYVYRLKKTSVLVNYVDEDGERLTDSITISGKVFDDYNTEEKTFYGYELTAVPENASGTMTEDEIVVNYVYRLKDSCVTVHYVDTDGNEIATSVTLNGKVFDSYTATAKDIYGYELTATPSNATGTMTETPIDVYFIYALRDAVVEVQYVTEKGINLCESITLTGKVFDKYDTESKDFYGYYLTAVPSNAEGTMTEDKITVTYVYALKDAIVVAEYVDENNKPLADTETITGKVYDIYETTAKQIYGYSLVETPENATGAMTEDKITVVYKYVPKDLSVIVRYIDEEGTEIAQGESLTGKVYEKYTTEAKDIYGYELTAIPDNANGSFTEEPIIVDYVYRLKDTSVIVNYTDQDGNKLTDSVTLPGKVFDEYTAEQKTFYGYQLTKVPENAQGQMEEDQIVVDFVYKLKGGNVEVNYVDEDGNSVATSAIIIGKVFDKYTTDAKDVYGYTLTKVPENANGQIAEEKTVVNYVYSLNDAKVMVNYIDEEGNKISDSVTITGKVFDQYAAENKDIAGYTLTSMPKNATGVMIDGDIIVNFVYTKTPEPNIPGTGLPSALIYAGTAAAATLGCLLLIKKRKEA